MDESDGSGTLSFTAFGRPVFNGLAPRSGAPFTARVIRFPPFPALCVNPWRLLLSLIADIQVFITLPINQSFVKGTQRLIHGLAGILFVPRRLTEALDF